MKTLKFLTTICLVLVCLSIFGQNPRIITKYSKGSDSTLVVTTREDTISQRSEFPLKYIRAQKHAIKAQKQACVNAADIEIARCDSMLANGIRLKIKE